MRGNAMMRGLVRMSVVLSCVWLVACTTPGPSPAEGGPQFPALTGPGKLDAVPDVDVLALTAPMKRLLAEQVMVYPESSGRLMALNRLFSHPDLLPLKYDRGQSRTAAETFAVGAADCVSFSNLVVAMARYVGLDAYYQDAQVRSNWERSGDLVVLRRHMNVVVGAGHRFDLYDSFIGVGRNLRGVLISDARARAQYFNNRGMEFFHAGDNEMALRYLKRALLIDPGLSYLWSNTGMVYGSGQHYDAAELFLRRALAVDRHNGSALVNLSELYRKLGREREADQYARMAEPYRRRNPYYLYELAEAAYQDGRYGVALDELQRALSIKSDAAFFEMLARVYWRLGEVEPARKSCRSAAGSTRADVTTAARGICAELEAAHRG